MNASFQRMLVAVAAVAAVAAALPVPVLAQRQEPARAQQGGAQQPQLVPHRAIYDFQLASVKSEKTVTSLTGRMVYEFTGSACEGYTQTMRFVTRTGAASGKVTVSDQRSTSWEDDAGMRYRFQSSQFRDQKLVEQSAGTATRGEGSEDIRIDLTHPDKRAGAISGEAMFPVQHSLRLLDYARRGRQSFVASFFDGSEGGEKTYSVSAQIGKQLPQSFNRTLPRAGQSEKLDGIPSWPIALSYFEHGSDNKDALPVYEMAFVFFANGVSRKLHIDNGEYSMKGELSELTLLDPVPCKR